MLLHLFCLGKVVCCIEGYTAKISLYTEQVYFLVKDQN
jgi:hypothetical protein